MTLRDRSLSINSLERGGYIEGDHRIFSPLLCQLSYLALNLLSLKIWLGFTVSTDDFLVKTSKVQNLFMASHVLRVRLRGTWKLSW